MKISELIEYLEQLAPLNYQESYDNCGLLVGQADLEISKALVSLDCTEAVIDEAIENGCNLVISHHPVIFKGLKKLNGKTDPERVVIKAIRHGIALYAIHTNLDNIYEGVSNKIADKLNLNNRKILDPKGGLLYKISVYVPLNYLEPVRQALFDAGAGTLGKYNDCSFTATGTGTFRASEDTQPFVGQIGERHHEPEVKLEVVVPVQRLAAATHAMVAAHPYEEVAYDVFTLENLHQEVGSGMIGDLPHAMTEQEFLAYLRQKMELEMIRFTPFSGKISRVAVCGGAGSFLLGKARASGAQAFVSADFKYHEFFEAEKQLLIADIGHYESEKFTISLLSELILKKFPTFAILLGKTNTNPVKYYS